MAIFDGDLDHVENEVRLFPSLRISSDREAEQRATAALLAMIKGVAEFGRAVVKLAGGPGGKISCYTEVCFPPFEPDGPQPRPDGIIRAVWGKQSWKALVEVKVGDTPLEQVQFDVYQRLAREHGFDALITVSCQAAQADGLPPLNVDGRRLRSMPVVHLSWDQLLTEAQVLTQRHGIADTDQEWMLSEWIRYVLDENSRIIQPPQLGQHWPEILKAAREASLPSVAKYLGELVESWEGFLKKEAFRLRAKLGVDVHVHIPLRERKEPEARFKRLYGDVLERSHLDGTIRIPDAASDVMLDVNLQARVVRFSVELESPAEGRQQTRVNWLVRQLRGTDTPQDLVVKIDWDRKGLFSQANAAQVQQESACLFRDGRNQIIPAETMPRRFILEWTRPLQNNRGRSTTQVLKGISDELEAFYRRVVQSLESYVAPAPKLPKETVQGAPDAQVQALAAGLAVASEAAGSGRVPISSTPSTSASPPVVVPSAESFGET